MLKLWNQVIIAINLNKLLPIRPNKSEKNVLILLLHIPLSRLFPFLNVNANFLPILLFLFLKIFFYHFLARRCSGNKIPQFVCLRKSLVFPSLLKDTSQGTEIQVVFSLNSKFLTPLSSYLYCFLGDVGCISFLSLKITCLGVLGREQGELFILLCSLWASWIASFISY